jgi:hypothetical protein
MIDPSSQFELQVCPNGRSKADEYLHEGAIWIEGREGSNYILRFINRLSSRVAVVFSVDGLDTIKGEPAGLNSESYVVNGNDSLEVPGWVINSSSAAEFYFAKAGRQYVAASGNNTSHTGVIGAMVFREKIAYQNRSPTCPWYGAPINGTPIYQGYYPTMFGQTTTITDSLNNAVVNGINNSDSNSTTDTVASSGVLRNATGGMGVVPLNMVSQTVSQDIGTGFGNATEFNTTGIAFTRANPTVPDVILAVYYNTSKNLQKMGINIKTVRTKYDNSTANPFPSYTPGCKPPPGWTS